MGTNLVNNVVRLGFKLSEEDQGSINSITLFVSLLCACIVIGHLLEENRWINESITALVIGVCTGGVILLTSNGASSRILEFNEGLFFIYLLPPIIFNAGFQVKKKQFFRNFIIIMMFGAIGTLISFCIISFGAKELFEKIGIGYLDLRDYLGNFLYLFSASTLLGVVVGLLSAYLIKKICFGRHSTDREIALMILLAYLSYMLAELFDLSGILTVFFCGIVMSHYTWHNVTASSQVTTRHAFATLSFIAEIFIFLYVGMDALDMEKWNFVKSNPGKYIGVSAVLLGLVLVGRACFVFLLSLLSNCTKRTMTDRINFKQQVIIWWAGLMRGSVSMALAYNQFTRFGHTQQPANAITITCTITVVLFSTVVFGLLTKPLVRWLLPQSQQLGGLLSPEQSALLPLLTSEQGSDVGEMGNVSLRRPSSLCMLLSQPTNTIHYYWRKFDDSWMQPVFGGGGEAPPGSPKGGGDILH